jgi:hypothetical protein
MRIISAILIATLLPSIASARSAYTPRYSIPAVRAAPSYHSAPSVRTYAPAVRTHQGVSPSVPHQSFSAPAVIHVPTVQHVPSGFRTGPHLSGSLHTTMPRVDRAVARHVPWRGRLFAVPVITVVGAPVWLDVPDLGEIIVDEQIYITELYPLLNSEQEADRERAYIRLKEIAEAQPTIRTDSAVVDDKIPLLSTCKPIGDCDQAELIFSKKKN